MGQCSEPFQVAAGISEVVEGPSPGYDLVDAATIPDDRLLTTNLINRTVDVEVPTSDDQNDETQVHFFNQTQRAQLKLCKTLGPGSADLIGQTFGIDWSSDNGAGGTAWITAPRRRSASSSATCRSASRLAVRGEPRRLHRQ